MNGLLYINKPSDWTSFDVVAKIRRSYGTKSVGHTGTLDPQATGVLIVMVGRACKANPYLVMDTKEYIATLRLGGKYDTGDIWGKVIEESTVPEVSFEQVETALKSMLGKQMQVPPMYSAVKVNGKKLYEYARNNQTVDVSAREIEISDVELLKMDKEIQFRVVCSSGTYIRVLCEELAQKLGAVGAMSALVRTRVGNISLDDCLELSDVCESTPQPEGLLNALSSRYSVIDITDKKILKNIYDGKQIHFDSIEELICLSYQGEAIAIFEKVSDGVYRSKRGLW